MKTQRALSNGRKTFTACCITFNQDLSWKIVNYPSQVTYSPCFDFYWPTPTSVRGVNMSQSLKALLLKDRDGGANPGEPIHTKSIVCNMWRGFAVQKPPRVIHDMSWFLKSRPPKTTRDIQVAEWRLQIPWIHYLSMLWRAREHPNCHLLNQVVITVCIYSTKPYRTKLPLQCVGPGWV